VKTKRPAAITLAVTAIALAILFIGIVDNPENSTVRNYFESASYTLIPSNNTNITQTPMTRIQLNTPQELMSQAQKLNNTTIYTEGNAPTTVYSYGVFDSETNTLYYYSTTSWFGMNINPLYAVATALLVIILTAIFCVKYGE